jgi:intracellular sulfur oxidation DsrE/DsrF family protein
VVVAPPFLSDRYRLSSSGLNPAGLLAARLFLPFLVLLCPLSHSQGEAGSETRYVADIELQTLDQFQQLLVRADELFLAGKTASDGDAAVIFVLHGPVLRSLLRENYPGNRQTVDMAARLTAFGVIELKACRAWMRNARIDEADLQPFIETVSYGPDEVDRLVRESGYIYF